MRSPYLYNGNSFTGKTVSLYWNRTPWTRWRSHLINSLSKAKHICYYRYFHSLWNTPTTVWKHLTRKELEIHRCVLSVVDNDTSVLMYKWWPNIHTIVCQKYMVSCAFVVSVAAFWVTEITVVNLSLEEIIFLSFVYVSWIVDIFYLMNRRITLSMLFTDIQWT